MEIGETIYAFRSDGVIKIIRKLDAAAEMARALEDRKVLQLVGSGIAVTRIIGRRAGRCQIDAQTRIGENRVEQDRIAGAGLNDKARALVEGFGAEAGDEVIEIRPGVSAGEITARRWQVA